MTIPDDVAPSVKTQIVALESAEATVRGQAALDLAQMGSAANPAVPWLVDLLGDKNACNWMKNAKVGEEAATALRTIKGDVAFNAVVAATTNENATVRKNAVWAFANDSTFRLEPRAIPHVLTLTKDKNAEVRKSAAKRLSGLAGIDYGDDSEAWQKWWKHYSSQHTPASEAVPSSSKDDR